MWGNHDYNVRKIKRKNCAIRASNFEFTDELSLLGPDGRPYLFVHGHQIEFVKKKGYEMAGKILCYSGEETGQAMSDLYSKVKHFSKTYNPFYRRFLNGYLEYMKKEPEDRKKKLPYRSGLRKLFWEYYAGVKFLETEHENKLRAHAKDRFKLAKDEVLVFGHTHQAWKGCKVANTGCWYKEEHQPKDKDENPQTIRYFVIQDNGDWELRIWPFS